uniref:Putative secreted protein n=1 Tax=Anopheles triannulatus TaxID=58253 RepID=A0A2M4A7P3_9DIPT
MPTLKPVGHQSTNWMVRLVLMVAMAALTSFGTTSPRYSMQQAMYLPWRGSHLTIWLAGSKQALVISATDSCSW